MTRRRDCGHRPGDPRHQCTRGSLPSASQSVTDPPFGQLGPQTFAALPTSRSRSVYSTRWMWSALARARIRVAHEVRVASTVDVRPNPTCPSVRRRRGPVANRHRRADRPPRRWSPRSLWLW